MKTFESGKKYRVGEQVMIECFSGLGSGGRATITKITQKYNPDTGKPYFVIWCKGHGFKESNGCAITPPYAYYITKIRQHD